MNRIEHISTNIHPGKIEKAVWDNSIHTLQDQTKILLQFSYEGSYSYSIPIL